MEHGCFTPVVLSTSGGMAPEATTFFRRLASLVSEKRAASYSTTLNWIRCCLSFSLLRSSLLCIRGSRSSQKTFCNTACNVELIATECCLYLLFSNSRHNHDEHHITHTYTHTLSHTHSHTHTHTLSLITTNILQCVHLHSMCLFSLCVWPQ